MKHETRSTCQISSPSLDCWPFVLDSLPRTGGMENKYLNRRGLEERLSIPFSVSVYFHREDGSSVSNVVTKISCEATNRGARIDGSALSWAQAEEVAPIIRKWATEIEYALVNLDRKNSRATMLLEQERVIRQWEARNCCTSDGYDQSSS
ncbi:hypothetical protein PENSUB_7346 [Penicillium subrubescens]|uniref:Uncharacterized protein n=1 Tax=Penicillium subrubescens TaxID=1316194 RepID=A0A1Q5TMA4_9EURO|nr:hypothetical protein PENSUB_7346 [Penicillium subrubescens]